MNRLELLLQLHQEQPNDPFLLYGIALEYQKTNAAEAADTFNRLLNEFPDYLPAYFQAADYFAEQKNYERALSVYDTGIALAMSLNELKTLAELKNAKQNLEIDLM